MTSAGEGKGRVGAGGTEESKDFCNAYQNLRGDGCLDSLTHILISHPHAGGSTYIVQQHCRVWGQGCLLS